jgi:hypothetical protein
MNTLADIVATLPGDFSASIVFERLALNGIPRPKNLSKALVELGYYKTNNRWAKESTARDRVLKYDRANIRVHGND